MRWELAPEQQMFQESFQGWLQRHAGLAAVRGWNSGVDPSAFEKRLAADGWLSVGTSEGNGGDGGGLLELALAES